MEWTERHDIILSREILISEPFTFKKGSVDKGKAWSTIADSLNSSLDLIFKVSQRSVRERFALIQDKYRRKNSKDERSSGTSIVMTELDILIEEITKEKAAEWILYGGNGNERKREERRGEGGEEEGEREREIERETDK